MASERRIEKLQILLKEELSKILDRDLEFPEGSLVTVTHVVISPDKHYATVFVTILGEKSGQALEMMRKNVYTIQQTLNRKVKMRPVPRIRFAPDEEEMRRETVEKSLAELKRKGEL